MTTTADLATGALSERQTPAWFDEAKLGMFVHWNPAVIAAYAPLTSLESFEGRDAQMWRRLPYAEMYWNTLEIEGSPTARYHAENFPGRGYEALVEEFRDRVIPAWDPETSAELCVRAGARYVVFTTMMEDGFLMWPSERPNPFRERWQSERDVVGELGAAVRRRGLRFGTYYCGGVDWTFKGLPFRTMQELLEATPQDAAYVEYAETHWRELIERYEPDVLWNDYVHPKTGDVPGLLAYYFERVPDGVVNNRFGSDLTRLNQVESDAYYDFLTPEYSTEGSPDVKWEACRGMGTSFGYNRMETAETYMSAEEYVHLFVDVVSRGGNLLANMSPTAAGAVPWLQVERLLVLGWWLETNGDAIYGTRPWVRHDGVTGEGLGVRYTASDDAVHAIVLGTPPRREVEVDVALDEDARVSLAGVNAYLPWEPTRTGVRITLPERLDRRPAISLRLEPKRGVNPFDES